MLSSNGSWSKSNDSKNFIFFNVAFIIIAFRKVKATLLGALFLIVSLFKLSLFHQIS